MYLERLFLVLLVDLLFGGVGVGAERQLSNGDIPGDGSAHGCYCFLLLVTVVLLLLAFLTIMKDYLLLLMTKKCVCRERDKDTAVRQQMI